MVLKERDLNTTVTNNFIVESSDNRQEIYSKIDDLIEEAKLQITDKNNFKNILIQE